MGQKIVKKSYRFSWSIGLLIKMRLEGGIELKEALKTRLDAVKINQGLKTRTRLRKGHLEVSLNKGYEWVMAWWVISQNIFSEKIKIIELNHLHVSISWRNCFWNEKWIFQIFIKRSRTFQIEPCFAETYRWNEPLTENSR